MLEADGQSPNRNQGIVDPGDRASVAIPVPRRSRATPPGGVKIQVVRMPPRDGSWNGSSAWLTVPSVGIAACRSRLTTDSAARVVLPRR